MRTLEITCQLPVSLEQGVTNVNVNKKDFIGCSTRYDAHHLSPWWIGCSVHQSIKVRAVNLAPIWSTYFLMKHQSWVAVSVTSHCLQQHLQHYIKESVRSVHHSSHLDTALVSTPETHINSMVHAVNYIFTSLVHCIFNFVQSKNLFIFSDHTQNPNRHHEDICCNFIGPFGMCICWCKNFWSILQTCR